MTDWAFEALADQYDSTFTHTLIGQELRQIVWRNLSDTFHRGAQVWELNCGTGEDAIWMARREIRVLASDGSPAMLETAARKAAAHQLSDRIEFLLYDFAHPAAGPPDAEFDGVLSNFGGLNCISDLRPLATVLARSIKPGGHLIVVVMGRWCAWEILWHLLHLQPRRAFRRLARKGTEGRIGSRKVWVWYPSAKALRRTFAPDFQIRRIVGLGVFLPPSYLHPVVAGRRGLFRLLYRLENSRASTMPLRFFGDHILYDFERTSKALRETG
jgi:ubiquinone/menaquinone biosynthesis C-methylase UbiE